MHALFLKFQCYGKRSFFGAIKGLSYKTVRNCTHFYCLNWELKKRVVGRFCTGNSRAYQ